MATQKHVDILKKGSKEWNEWRKQYPSIIPDLSFAKLIELLLSEVDLSFAKQEHT